MPFSPVLLPSVRRRNLLKTFLYGATASTLPWLTGCGSSENPSGSSSGRVAASETNRFGGTALSNNQFRFRNIGPLGEADTNGVRTAAGPRHVQP